MQNVVSLCKYKHPKQKSSRVLTGYLVPLASVCILLTAFNPGAGIVPISGNLTPVCRWHSTSDHSKSRNRSERREIRKYKQELNNKTSMHGMGKLTQNSDARARLVENPPSLGHPHDVLTVRPPCFYGFIFSINCNTVQERWREPASLFSWCWPNCKETHLKRKKMIVRLHKAPRLPGRFSFTWRQPHSERRTRKLEACESVLRQKHQPFWLSTKEQRRVPVTLEASAKAIRCFLMRPCCGEKMGVPTSLTVMIISACAHISEYI